MTYYGIYKITNLLNGKMYIGQHTTTNIDDGYMGSGKIILRALKKYGKENFRKEWLMFCEDEEELNYMERVYVDQTWVDRSDTYNIRLGGGNSPMAETTKRKLSEINLGKKHSEETKKKISDALKGKPTYMKGRHHSLYSRLKTSKALKGKTNGGSFPKGHQPWNKGQKTGLHWFTDGKNNIQSKTCPVGYKRGMTKLNKEETI